MDIHIHGKPEYYANNTSIHAENSPPCTDIEQSRRPDQTSNDCLSLAGRCWLNNSPSPTQRQRMQEYDNTASVRLLAADRPTVCQSVLSARPCFMSVCACAAWSPLTLKRRPWTLPLPADRRRRGAGSSDRYSRAWRGGWAAAHWLQQLQVAALAAQCAWCSVDHDDDNDDTHVSCDSSTVVQLKYLLPTVALTYRQ